MKTPIAPLKFLAVLDQLQTGAPYLCVVSNQGAPRVWTAFAAPVEPFVQSKRFAAGDMPTPDRLAHLIAEMAVKSKAARRFAREKAAVLEKRRPNGYIARRLAAAVEGGVV